MRKRIPPRVLAFVVATQTVSAAVAWRDLKRRPADRLRGPRRLWQLALMANPGNSVLYWAIARRKPASVASPASV